jgi:hypothetical protein
MMLPLWSGTLEASTRLADFHPSAAGYFHVVDHLRAERHHDLDYS